MMSGFSMLSFDLFGLFRRVRAKGVDKEKTGTEAPHKGSIFFFGMFPVL